MKRTLIILSVLAAFFALATGLVALFAIRNAARSRTQAAREKRWPVKVQSNGHEKVEEKILDNTDDEKI